ATASRDKTAALWDAHTGKRGFTLEGHTESVRDLSFGPGSRLATGGGHRMVRVWGTATGRALATLPAHPGGLCNQKPPKNWERGRGIGKDVGGIGYGYVGYKPAVSPCPAR